MTARIPTLVLLAAVVALAALPASAQPAVAEAQVKVFDTDGNPLKDVKVILSPKTAETEYSGTSNKKGRAFIPGLYSAQGDRWELAVEAEGLVPVGIRIESRNAQRVLVGDIEELELAYGQAFPTLQIRPLGTIELEITMGSEEAARAAALEAANADAGDGVEVVMVDGEAVQVEKKADPWEQALATANAGDLEGALPLFRKAVSEEPDDVERIDAYARVLYQVGDYDTAEETIRRAIEIDPQRVESRMVLYSTYVGAGRMDDARQTLVETREIAPDDLRILRQLAFVADETGRSEDAIDAYEGIVAVDPKNKDAWVALGDLYAKSGDTERSKAAYEKVTELAPDEAHRVFFNIGALIMNKGDATDDQRQKAVDAFRRAVEIKPDYAAAHKQLAFALLGTGDRAGAKAALQNYVKYAPDAPDAAQMKSLIEQM